METIEISILIIFAIIGFFVFKFFSGRYEGHRPERSLRFLIKGYYIHIHHWIYDLAILIVLISLKIHFLPLYGFFIGAIIQGITYKDWYIIIYHKDNYEKIYSKWRPKNKIPKF